MNKTYFFHFNISIRSCFHYLNNIYLFIKVSFKVTVKIINKKNNNNNKQPKKKKPDTLKKLEK